VLLALTADAPVFVSQTVLDEDGIDAPEPDEDAVAEFREFLDHVSAEDFGADDAAPPTDEPPAEDAGDEGNDAR
jgi:hypothetical protein